MLPDFLSLFFTSDTVWLAWNYWIPSKLKKKKKELCLALVLFSAHVLKPCQVEIRYTASLPSSFIGSIPVSVEKKTWSMHWQGIAAWSNRFLIQKSGAASLQAPPWLQRLSQPGVLYSFCRHRQEDLLLSVALPLGLELDFSPNCYFLSSSSSVQKILEGNATGLHSCCLPGL